MVVLRLDHVIANVEDAPRPDNGKRDQGDAGIAGFIWSSGTAPPMS